jgi:hypothetical protein
MHRFRLRLLALPLLLASAAHAQTAGTITFTANKTSAQGSLVPVLTWSTTPVASGCVASGAWSGSKFASGSVTLPTITASKAYTLTCTWGNGLATLKWTPPTQNTDNSALTNLTGYRVLYGTSASALSQQKIVSGPNATGTSIPALGAGTWYFAVRATNANASESGNSNVTQKTIVGASAAKSVNITITAATTPTLKTTATSVYDVDFRDGVRVIGLYVGTIAIGKPCQSHYKVGTTYWKVAPTDVVITRTPDSPTIIARCAIS